MRRTRSLPTQYSAARRTHAETIPHVTMDQRGLDLARAEIDALRPGESWMTDHPVRLSEFDLLTYEDSRVELFEGVIYMPDPSPVHEALYAFLFNLLYSYVMEKKLGLVRGSRTGVRIDDYSAPQPDILFVRRLRAAILQHAPLREPADMLMEIISSNSGRTRAMAKVIRYQEIGVPEIWCIDLLRQHVRVIRRTKRGNYETIFEGSQGAIRSGVVSGFAVRAKWLWSSDTDFPSVVRVVRALLAGRLPR